MNKINIIGTSGSGKSTFSAQLADTLGIESIEMDAIFWGPNWHWPTDDEFFAKLQTALKPEQWVLDGNYTRTIPIKWHSVDTVIWIDFSLSRTVYQAFTRAVKRIRHGRELWPGTGNKETFKKTFLSRESIIFWTLTNFKKNRRRYAQMMSAPEYSHIRFIRLRSPRACREFLQQLAQSSDINSASLKSAQYD